MWCQGSQVSMHVVRGSPSLFSSHGRGLGSSCGARGGFLPRHDEDLREPLVSEIRLSPTTVAILSGLPSPPTPW